MFNHISKTNKTRKWNFPNFGFCLIVHFKLSNSVMSLFTFSLLFCSITIKSSDSL